MTILNEKNIFHLSYRHIERIVRANIEKITPSSISDYSNISRRIIRLIIKYLMMTNMVYNMMTIL
jgi:radical SAM superfamily enzyme with C-terminal helix-hairpin-helix motif